MTATTATTDSPALNAFIRKQARALELAQALSAHIADHFETHPDAVHWGDVGAAAEVVDTLESLAAFLGLPAAA